MITRLVVFLCSLYLASTSLLAAPLSEEPWRVIYQVYVRAFYDGSIQPDGQGDFRGLAQKLEVLKDLGVNTLLLMPIFESTGDMGYIPRDYFKIDRAYGDTDEFEQFVKKAKANGFKIILDAPVNHISYDSQWFKRGSQKNCDPNDIAHNPFDPDNKYCDFFYFSKDPCREYPYFNWHKPWWYDTTDCRAVWFLRPDFNPVYHRDEYHYATFFDVMPDLKFFDYNKHQWNWPVINEIKGFFEKWTKHGVDGFRIDAAKHFVEGYETNGNAQEPMNLTLLNMFLNHARTLNKDISFIAEIWSSHEEFEPYLPNSTDVVLDFPFMEALRSDVNNMYAQRLKSVLQHFENTQDEIKPANRIVFAGNHDVSRMMSEWSDDENKLRMAHFLSLTTPFIPLIYYGEEIGMHGKVKRPDHTSNEEYVRTINVFSWTNDNITAGFTKGTISPLSGLSDNFKTRNLASQLNQHKSTWYMIQKLLKIRKNFGITNNTRISVNDDIYGHLISYTLSNDQTCQTVYANLDQHNYYDIQVEHADSNCKGTMTTAFAENAEHLHNNVYRLKPNAKLILN